MSPSFKLIAILALVAFLAIAIYLLVNHIVYILITTRNVQIEITEGKGQFHNNTTFKVINNGAIPVNHVNLKIMTPYEIANYTMELSTVPVDYRVTKPKYIDAYAPKLVQGPGSFILLSIAVNETKPTGYDRYSAYAVYEEGSNKADLISCLTPCLQIHDIEKGITTFDKSILISLLALGVAILGAGLLLILLHSFNYLKNFPNLTKRKVD